ncbi:MFS transporter [Shimia thalassica]|uniref:MFS transporter n=1 Tax=Shimia thalassica TaxID=1715693 RepID=UPI0026E46BFC|nr:MFS transporter [Shimia thalassica]MDO6522274.1 MFS transporter [Shimia thalassica]
MSRTSFGTVTLVLALWLAGLGASAQFAKFAVPFSYVHLQYPDAETELGWLLTLISSVGAVLGMTAGVLVARAGLGRTVVTALFLGGAISLWQSTLPALPVMLFSRVFEGISHLMIVVAAPTLMAQLASDRYRGLCMTLWSTFFGVSFALMAWFGLSFVEDQGLGALLTGHGTYMILTGLVIWVCLNRFGPTLSLPAEGISLAIVLKKHLDAYRSPNVAAPAVGWFFYTLTFVSLLTLLPELLPPESRATIAGLLPLVSIAVSLFFVSALLSRFSAVAVTVLGFALSAVAIALFFAGFSLPFVCIGLFSALGLIQGASFASVPELNLTNEARATANGAVAQMGNLGNLIGTPILLVVLANGGPPAMLMTVLGLYCAGGLAHLVLRRVRNSCAIQQQP